MSFTEFGRWTDGDGDPVTDIGPGGRARIAGSSRPPQIHAPCFTAHTRIATDLGLRPASALREGDRVLTRDNGYQEIRWIGSRRFSRGALLRDARLCPIRISAGVLCGQGDARALLVSPQHRLLVRSGDVATEPLSHSDEDACDAGAEALVTADSFVRQAGVARVIPKKGVTYVHFLLDRHEIVLSDGCWSESFRPSPETLRGLTPDQVAQILSAFPDLAGEADSGPVRPARPLVRRLY